VYLDNHCQVQKLSNNLPGSYEMEEIFCTGSANPLFFSAHDSGYHKTPIQISADEVNQNLCAMMLTGEQKPS
jgi:hypothetical protein